VRANRFLAVAFPLLFAAGNGLLNELLAWRRRRRPAPDAAGGAGERYAVLAATALAFLTVNGLVPAGSSAANWKALAVVPSPLLVDSNAAVLAELRRFQEIVAPGARVATCWAGIPAFFSDYRLIDVFGYSDRHTARLPSAVRLTPRLIDRYVPGHVKWDYDHVFRRRPHAFFQTWQLGDETAAVMARHGFVERDGFWVRRGSPWLRNSVD
jgi:hypothetical protein